jgi:hypothetical protein
VREVAVPAEDHTEGQEEAAETTITIERDRRKRVRSLRRPARKVVSTRPKVGSRTAVGTGAVVAGVDTEATTIDIRTKVATHRRAALIPSIETTMLALREVKMLKVASVL